MSFYRTDRLHYIVWQNQTEYFITINNKSDSLLCSAPPWTLTKLSRERFITVFEPQMNLLLSFSKQQNFPHNGRFSLRFSWKTFLEASNLLFLIFTRNFFISKKRENRQLSARQQKKALKLRQTSLLIVEHYKRRYWSWKKWFMSLSRKFILFFCLPTWLYTFVCWRRKGREGERGEMAKFKYIPRTFLWDIEDEKNGKRRSSEIILIY